MCAKWLDMAFLVLTTVCQRFPTLLDDILLSREREITPKHIYDIQRYSKQIIDTIIHRSVCDVYMAQVVTAQALVSAS